MGITDRAHQWTVGNKPHARVIECKEEQMLASRIVHDLMWNGLFPCCLLMMSNCYYFMFPFEEEVSYGSISICCSGKNTQAELLRSPTTG